MAISVNRVILVGRLGKDPEAVGTDGGIVRFSLATSERWRDKGSGEMTERTQWHQIVIFNEQAGRFAKQYMKRGDLAYIEGCVETREYEKDGDTRRVTEIVVRPYTGSVQSMPRDSDDRREEAEDTRPARREREDKPRTEPGMRDGSYSRDLDDEIPF